jgi:hypothetical protein
VSTCRRRWSSWAPAAPPRSPTHGASSGRPRRPAPSALRPCLSRRIGTQTTGESAAVDLQSTASVHSSMFAFGLNSSLLIDYCHDDGAHR